MIEKLAFFHNVECDFYEIFKKFDCLPIPKVSFTQKFLIKEKQIGAIFMEDMSKTMANLGIFNGMNIFQVIVLINLSNGAVA